MRALALVTLLLASPATADVADVVNEHILPRFGAFATQTANLSDAAQTDCTAEALRPAYQEAFDAWIGISHLLFGPLETDGRNLSIAFWPDTRGMTVRTVADLIASEDPAVSDPDAFAEVSIAGRGLFALERVLYDPDMSDYGSDSYTCQLAQALATDLARTGASLDTDWAQYQTLLLTAGDDGNTAYLTEGEALQELYTALMTGLEFTKDQRLGRPLGTFDRPRPTRAEAWRSGRPLRDVILSLEATREFAHALANAPTPHVDAAYTKTLEIAADLDDPDFAGVADPFGRLRVEILQQNIGFLREAIATEIGVALGLSEGFNAADGD